MSSSFSYENVCRRMFNFLNSVSIEHYPTFSLGYDSTAGLITLEYFQLLREPYFTSIYNYASYRELVDRIPYIIYGMPYYQRPPAEAIDFITTRTSLEELDFELTVRGF